MSTRTHPPKEKTPLRAKLDLIPTVPDVQTRSATLKPSRQWKPKHSLDEQEVGLRAQQSDLQLTRQCPDPTGLMASFKPNLTQLQAKAITT